MCTSHTCILETSPSLCLSVCLSVSLCLCLSVFVSLSRSLSFAQRLHKKTGGICVRHQRQVCENAEVHSNLHPRLICPVSLLLCLCAWLPPVYYVRKVKYLFHAPSCTYISLGCMGSGDYTDRMRGQGVNPVTVLPGYTSSLICQASLCLYLLVDRDELRGGVVLKSCASATCSWRYKYSFFF